MSGHERLNFESIRAYQRVAHWLDDSTPVILETPVKQNEVDEEISLAGKVFACRVATTIARGTSQIGQSINTGSCQATNGE
jgi:hypothetical protein